MIRSAFALATIVLVGSATIAAAEPPSSAPAERTPTDPNERICKSMTVTGSRLAVRTVCATRAEWERRSLEDRKTTERLQAKPCVGDGSGSGVCH
jgi:hypothetical protein